MNQTYFECYEFDVNVVRISGLGGLGVVQWAPRISNLTEIHNW